MTATAPAPAPQGPTFLRGLDNALPADDGYVADCPICRQLLDITPDELAARWQLTCDGGCTHDEIADWLHADTRLDHEHLAAIWRAVVLAPTLEVCQALLRGERVPKSALDPMWARRFRL